MITTRWFHVGRNGEIALETSCASESSLDSLSGWARELLGEWSPAPPGPAICTCPMLVGGGIDHSDDCPEMAGKRSRR